MLIYERIPDWGFPLFFLTVSFISKMQYIKDFVRLLCVVAEAITFVESFKRLEKHTI